LAVRPKLLRLRGAVQTPAQTVFQPCSSYFLLLVCSHRDDTFPAMANRPPKTLLSRISLIAGAHRDLASILIGQETAWPDA
jgi:hypothetical protein